MKETEKLTCEVGGKAREHNTLERKQKKKKLLGRRESTAVSNAAGNFR